MKIEFKSFDELPSYEATDVFEQCYEPNLRLDLDDKYDIVTHGVSVWMFVDGKLAGEMYGIQPVVLSMLWEDEIIEDLNPMDESLYTYSSTILPEFQGKGLGKVLKAYFLGVAAGLGYKRVTGHSTAPAMSQINNEFGAKWGTVHEHWYGTNRTAIFYEIKL